MLHALEERHGIETQKRFSKASVAICGLGGLGSNIAIMLARAGIGRLHLIDFDKVDLSNLNRQQYAVSQLGMYKTQALTETLKAIAPYCAIVARTERITENNIKDLFCVFEGKDVKSIEVSWCDDVNEIRAKIPELKREYGYK